MSPITTQELLDQAADRTGLAEGQLLLMAAKSATVRHIAEGPDSENFVLKGGTLLTHVYESPRQSIADADYVHLQNDPIDAKVLKKVLTMEEESHGMAFKPEVEWIPKRDEEGLFDARGGITFSDIAVRKRVLRDKLKVTVSVRKAEVLDPQEPIPYTDPLLAERSSFLVNGLSCNELAAEKILAWCSKDLPKHFVDLAYLGREHGGRIDHETVAGFVRDKFSVEKKERRYRDLEITRAHQLPKFFSDPDRINRELKGRWANAVGSELLFLPGEQNRPADESLAEADTVERLTLEFWEPTLATLRGSG